MSKATAARRLSPWQKAAVEKLHSIAHEHPDAIQIVSPSPTLTNTYVVLTIALPTQDLTSTGNGLRFRADEQFLVGIGPHPLSPPVVEVTHARFLGHPHVLQGHRLCIYLDPAREWNPLGGMTAFLERLWAWLEDAAAGRFNAATAMYHAVGGVLHRTPGTPTVVIRDPIPARPAQRARLVARTAHRYDLRFGATTSSGYAVPVLTLVSDLPLGAGLTLAELVRLLDNPVSYGPPQHTGLGPTPSHAVLISLVTSAVRNPNGSSQYFTLAVPHPAGGPTHLLVGRLPVAASDRLRQLAEHHGSTIDVDPAQVGEGIPIEWCSVSDERTEVTTRRDDHRPVNAFHGATVHIWGCGGLGSWIAEFAARAGATTISLCDPGAVTGGLLVRQDYVEADIGNTKASALADRLRSVSDEIEIEVIPGALPDDLEQVLATTDVIIDATVSIAVGQTLAAAIARARGRTLLAQVATDTRSGTLGVLTVSAAPHPQAPAEIDAHVGTVVLAEPALEAYHGLWLEPLEGHELTPTRGCSAPTFHGSAADLAAVAASLTTFIGTHLTMQTSGTHLIALPHADAGGPHHAFFDAGPAPE